MKKIVILIILFTIWSEMNIKEMDCEKQASLKKFPLRQFRISFNKNAKKGNLKNGLSQRKEDELEKQREETNNEKILQEEAMRRRIYVANLLRFQGGSNILKDFLTNRF
jgi:hypothetical protein